MIVYDLVGDNEAHPIYQKLAADNLKRQYSYLQSVVETSIALDRPMLSMEVIKSLHYHALAGLHSGAGEFRPWFVDVSEDFTPAPHYRVGSLMQMFVDEVNRGWDSMDPLFLAAFVLWKLNYIHPFINGNGRTARVLCLFVLCLKMGSWLQGDRLLPELIRDVRPKYITALKRATKTYENGEKPDLRPLRALIERLLKKQIESARETASLRTAEARATIAVSDIDRARAFYEPVLGLVPTEERSKNLILYGPDNNRIILYRNEFAGTGRATVATWVVGEHIEQVVGDLAAKGVKFEHFDFPGVTRQSDVHISGSDKAAWFRDPDGNLLNIVNR